ncbi:LysE family translocator [Streptomyces sp. NPDC001292]|uniref:LysE family translocator n=1 Tax=Streptomyces sp. NPDC001292 TaxID=3364558 RepID=UPI0036960ECA
MIQSYQYATSASTAIHWTSAGPLLLVALAVMGSPGPATLSLVAAGSAYGVRRSFAYLMGIVIGTTAVLFAVATGVTAALLAVPSLRLGLLATSIVYIGWLAYNIMTAPPLSQNAAPSRSPSLAGGALLGIANPKAWIAIAAVFSTASLAESAAADAALKLVLLTVMIVLINGAWLFAGAALTPLLRAPRPARIVNVSMAILLVAATAFPLIEK